MSGNYNPATMARAKRFAQTTAATATPTNVFTVSNEQSKSALKNVNFPVQMGTSDAEDRKYALMSKVVNPGGVVPGVGQNIVGDDYFNYVTRKMDVAQEVVFKDWLMKQADLSRPESADYWISRFPWMLGERLAEVDRVCELQKRKARIEVAGPDTPEDWEFLFNEQRGLITVPDTPVHKLPEANKVGGYTEGQAYSRGMFSPMVNYIPPFKEGSAQYKAAYQPINNVTWNNPTGAGTAPTGGHLTIPQTLPGYVDFPGGRLQ